MATLATLRKQFHNAKRRLKYWSGNPSFRANGFSPRHRLQGEADIEYERALDDCDSLADEIEQLTGKRPAVVDVRQEFRERFSKAFHRKGT